MDLQFLVDHYRRTRGVMPPEILYHYTKPWVVPEFFEDEADFLCTRASHLNDDSEILAGARLYWGYLKRNAVLPCGHLSFLNSLLGEAILRLPVVPFIMSFSVDRNSSTQWSKYTDSKAGGFSVGFSRQRLHELICRHMAMAAANPMPRKFVQMLCPCYYQGVDDLDDYFAARVRGAQDAFEKFATFIPSSACDARYVAAEILSAAAFVKVYDAKNTWHDEHEWRLVYWPAVGSLQESVVYKDDKRPRVWAEMGGCRNQGAIRGAIVSLDVRPEVCEFENSRKRCDLLNRLYR